MSKSESNKQSSLCGIWVSPEGEIHCSYRSHDGAMTEERDRFSGFGWLCSEDLKDEDSEFSRSLNGGGPYNRLLETEDQEVYKKWVSKEGYGRLFENIRPQESQHLLKQQMRLFEGMRFEQLKRCQVDIETDSAGNGAFSNPYQDRVLAIGMKMGDEVKLLCLETEDADGEGKLLESFNETLQEWDPDVIEGHNIFSFDLNYLGIRCKRRKIPCKWGRYGQLAKGRKSRLKVAERWLDFQRWDLPGRTVFDTYLMVQLYDITSRDMPSYGLKAVAEYFGVTQKLERDRTYIEGAEIHKQFREDRETFLRYLEDDLRETEGVASILLPTYFEQCKSFPVLLQEACLRGTSSKVDLLFLEKYYHAAHALPEPAEGFGSFEGGFTRSFKEGVFKNVLHYDVASLYPSLLLGLDRNPLQDDLGVFLSLLKELREYRLKYKKLAKSDPDPAMRREYGARQASYKILINSFYGYLGFPGARFGDGELAASVTADGRELLQKIIEIMEANGAEPLEADTDGIYVASEKWARDPMKLLELVQAELPDGIDLELGGEYETMLCYKAKNYALYDGEKVLIRGSALRSRGTEPYLGELTKNLIHALTGAIDADPLQMLNEMRTQIENQRIDVTRLAKTEFLNQSPTKYQKMVEEGGKPRRAALEVALKQNPVPKMGERVQFYIGPKSKGQTAMWQRSFAVSEFDPVERPYDVATYIKKLDEWETKYADLIGKRNEQVELF